MPVVCVDGTFVGVWRSKRKGSGAQANVVVEIEPFGARTMPRAVRSGAEAEAEAERLAAFLGGALELRWL